MAYQRAKVIYQTLIDDIRKAGTYKVERVITSKQGTSIHSNSKEVLNFCANNYLGFSGSPEALNPALETAKTHGFGLSSVRFICGTQDIHKKLEQTISEFHHKEDAILYSSCFDANAGVFEALLTKEDAVLTDALNHASIIDGIRLCGAERHIYRHLDMQHLEECLQKSQNKRIRMIVTDGVFSMDGDFAPLPEIVNLAEKYNALLFVDESHATGFIGPTGRGTPEYFGVEDKVDIINSTLGKAMGGASGGYSTGHKELIEVLRQKSRPYLFSNSLAPMIVGATLGVFETLNNVGPSLIAPLNRNIALFRGRMKEAGFQISGHKDCPIVPVMIGDAALANVFADKMMSKNIYVIGFSFPVVPKGQARIRVQLSAKHTEEQVNLAVDAFISIGRETGLIKT